MREIERGAPDGKVAQPPEKQEPDLPMVIQDLFEIDEPVAFLFDDANGGSILLKRIQIGEIGDRIIEGADIDHHDRSLLVFLLIFRVQVIIILFPFGQHHLVRRIGVQIEAGFFVVAVQRGTDEFTTGIFRVFGLFERMRIVTSDQEEEQGDEFLYH